MNRIAKRDPGGFEVRPAGETGFSVSRPEGTTFSIASALILLFDSVLSLSVSAVEAVTTGSTEDGGATVAAMAGAGGGIAVVGRGTLAAGGG